jgi:hypothetical protein
MNNYHPPVDIPYTIGDRFGWVKNYPLHLDGVPGALPKPGPEYGFHTGIDLVSKNGRLYLIEDASITTKPNNGDDGNAVYYTATDGRRVAYCHLASFAVVGGRYPAGTYLGMMGDSGAANGVHVHIAMLLNGTYIDPTPYVLPAGKGGGVADQTTDEQKIFDEGERADFNFRMYGVDKGFHKEQVGKPWQQAWYEATTSFGFRQWHYVNSGDLHNYMGRDVTADELKEFQIGDDGVAIPGGGTTHKNAVYILLKSNRLNGGGSAPSLTPRQQAAIAVGESIAAFVKTSE